jgi:hypothetical protein
MPAIDAGCNVAEAVCHHGVILGEKLNPKHHWKICGISNRCFRPEDVGTQKQSCMMGEQAVDGSVTAEFVAPTQSAFWSFKF